MLSKGKLSQIRTAYRSVHGQNNVEENILVRCGNEIIFNPEKYPFESDDLMSMRFSTISDISDSDSINEYLSKVPEKEFSGDQKSIYGRLFELGAKYGLGILEGSDSTVKPNPTEDIDDIEDTKEEEVSKQASDNIPEGINTSGYNSGMEESDSSNHGTKSAALEEEVKGNIETINNNKSKEEVRMDTKINAIDQLQDEANKLGVGNEVGANITQVSKDDKLAAKKVVEDTQVSRMDYSKNAKVTKVLITAIDREKKAVEGRASMGKVSNPKKALEMFITKTGCTVEDGVVKFSKLHSSELHDNAVKMYNVLNSAMADPELQVEPYFGKEGAAIPVSIKGIVVNDPANKESILAQKDIAAHILRNAFLYLNVDSKSNAQFLLDAATARGGKEPKKSYVVRVANKSDLIDDETVCVYVKKIIDRVSESKTGYKSALSISCNSTSLDTNGNPKKTTWRIPLEVEQYEVEIVDKYSDLFRAGVGNQVKPINAETEADISNIVDKITTMIAAEATKSSTESIVGASMLAQLNDEKGKIAAQAAAAVNDTLGAGVSDEDFEA